MFRGFNLTLDQRAFELSGSSAIASHNRNKNLTRAAIDKFYENDGSLNGSKIIADWFPSIKADVFISHSHSDSALAIQFAGWLKEKFGISSFIDSCVWGYSEDLLKKLNDKYSLGATKGSYDYSKVIRAAGHVNMMLSTALTKMIYDCEAIVFINTPSSLTAKDYIHGSTNSPWIYSEILMTRLVQKRTPEEHRQNIFESISNEVLSKSMNIKYDIDLDHLSKLTFDNLKTWESKKKLGADALDLLYTLGN